MRCVILRILPFLLGLVLAAAAPLPAAADGDPARTTGLREVADSGARFEVGAAGGGVIGVATPGFQATGGGGVEWGVGWPVHPRVRIGLRNTFQMTVLPWSRSDEMARVGDLVESPEVENPATREWTLLSGLVVAAQFDLGGPVQAELSAGPALVASARRGLMSLVPLPMAGAALSLRLYETGSHAMRLRIGMDAIVPLTAGGEASALLTPYAGVSFVF